MNYYSLEPEAGTSSDAAPRCRLCLQWTDEDDGNCGLQNIFTESDDSLPFRIQDCLGMLVLPEDRIRTICTNCRHMVSLIDEFRMLCRQTEEIYVCVRIQCEDTGRLKRYGQCVSELRKLVQEHKHMIDEHFFVEGETDEESQDFAPTLLVKEEPKVHGQEWNGDERDEESGWDINVLDIKPDRLPTDECTEAANENIEGEPPEDCNSTDYDQQVKLAQEVLQRLEHFNSDTLNNEQQWAEIAEQVGMKYSAIGTLWNRMKHRYLTSKAGAATGSWQMILRLESCALFNLMNQIVPALDDSVEPWIVPEIEDTDERTQRRKSFPMELKIAIAEEIKNTPQLWWDKLLGSSTEQIWETIAVKFNMDASNLREHWRLLQDFYRKRVKDGARSKAKASCTQLHKLIGIMDHIYEIRKGEAFKHDQEADQCMVEEDDDTDLQTEKKIHSQMALAKLVYKHQLLWDQEHKNYHVDPIRKEAWDRIAETLNKTRDEIKYEWKKLRDMYRSMVKRRQRGLMRHTAKGVPEPLFKLLKLMLAGNMHLDPIADAQRKKEKDLCQNLPVPLQIVQPPAGSGSVEAPEDHGDEDTIDSETDAHMKLALLCEMHEIIWNSKHLDHTNLEKRDIVWDFIARKMNQTRVQTKSTWSRLRNMYRCRKLRLLQGNIREDSRLLRDPLYQKLDTLLKDHMQLGKYGAKIRKSEPSEAVKLMKQVQDNKARLVEEVIKYEFLWDADHSDFYNNELRDETWKRIAESMNQTCEVVKHRYRMLRDAHRYRVKRLKQKNKDPNTHFKHDPLLQKINTIFFKSIRVQSDVKLTSDDTAHMTDESEAKYAVKDHHGDGDTVKYDTVALKLVELCEKNELIWNSKHPSYTNIGKKDSAWDSISEELNLSKDLVKEEWTRLRNLYRTRRLRYLQGSITRDHALLCDPLYQKLHAMLRDHMQLGKRGGGFPKKGVPEQEQREPGPFATMENKVRLVEEVFKQELLWNTTHVDYSNSNKRGATWTQIAEMFDNCDASVAESEWHRMWSLTRLRKSHSLPIVDNEEDEPPNCQTLNELFSKMTERLNAVIKDDPDEEGTEAGESSGATHTQNDKKRQRKRRFSNDGYIKVTKHGMDRYEKICDVCGKQIPRSTFEYHMNQHNGLTPYACSFEGCDRRYTSKPSCDRHEKTHLAQTQNAKRRRVRKQGLKRKRRITFKRRFKDEGCIKVIKQGIERYEKICNLCGKQMPRSLFEYHMNQHNGLTPYACSFEGCDRRYTNRPSRDRHEKSHLRKIQ